MSSILQDLKDLRRDLGDWYDYLGNCDFNLTSTTFRAKRRNKLKTLDVNAQAHMFAVRELPSILEKAIEKIEQLQEARAENHALAQRVTVAEGTLELARDWLQEDWSETMTEGLVELRQILEVHHG